ncbi:lipase family protein [Actinomadura parmotrematis]|uniref:Lipase family protein n=1 Tax=Actinomadura parmotrematis TaxID=2864039 RepID=A0ABS7FRW1_9ACTN|nr:lipase family protein [Actinomadura parmotrematis]MBW8483138.1 lipase family protein [Actinomadura parmotrematis]
MPPLPSGRRGARAAAALPLAAALALTALTAPARADTPPAAGSVPPDQDPFYAAPANIGGYRPGQIVASRKITPKVGDYATKTDTWQISYRSNDSHGAPTLIVTSLMVPKKAWTGTGPRPAVSVQAAEDSTGTQCAPSYGLSSGSVIAGWGAAWSTQLLDKGWAVAMPDHEGPKSVFMAGPQAGHAVLDGIRAVKNFTAAPGIGKDNPWTLNGYSGGAQATGWAAELQPSYAPDVELKGAAMGGTPADPEAVARFLDGGIFSGFEAAAAASLATEFPEMDIDPLMNDAGRKALADARGKCLTDLLIQFPFKKLSGYSTVPDPLAVPRVKAVLKLNTLGSAAPATPVFDYHANTDEIVPAAQDDALVKAWCTKGATVQTVRDAIGEHALEMVTRSGDALAFLSDRYAGKPAPDTC